MLGDSCLLTFLLILALGKRRVAESLGVRAGWSLGCGRLQREWALVRGCVQKRQTAGWSLGCARLQLDAAVGVVASGLAHFSETDPAQNSSLETTQLLAVLSVRPRFCQKRPKLKS